MQQRGNFQARGERSTLSVIHVHTTASASSVNSCFGNITELIFHFFSHHLQ